MLIVVLALVVCMFAGWTLLFTVRMFATGGKVQRVIGLLLFLLFAALLLWVVLWALLLAALSQFEM